MSVIIYYPNFISKFCSYGRTVDSCTCTTKYALCDLCWNETMLSIKVSKSNPLCLDNTYYLQGLLSNPLWKSTAL